MGKTKRCSFSLDAATLYEDGSVAGLRREGAAAAAAIILDDAVLIEDDADGCGFPYEQEILGEGVAVRKTLLIDASEARGARVLVFHTVEKLWETPAHDAPVTLSINGHEQPATLKVGWNSVAVDPASLRPGPNEIIIVTQDAAKPAIIPIASRQAAVENAPWLACRAPRSHKSADGGKTWSEGLGLEGRAAGEYMIRLRLDQFVSAGECVSAVLDLAECDEGEALKRLATVHSLSCRIEKDCPPGTQVQVWTRTGPTPVFDASAWEDWRPLAPGKPRCPRGRYFQAKVALATSDATKTPAFRGLRVIAAVEYARAGAGAAKRAAGAIRVEESQSRPIARSSLPFECEPLDHPALRELRTRYRLDEVVAGAATQFEQFVRLNHWVSQQWKWHAPVEYPGWNALEILEKLPSGEPRGGFCGQFAIAMMQCCLAMGFQARFTFGAWKGVIYGHEITEVWSDEHGKWVLMDPNMDRHYLDRSTGVPMNAMDLHRSLLAFYFAGGRLGDDAHNKTALEAKDFDEYVRTGPVIVHGGTNAGPDWFDGRRAHLMWGQPAIMPRNDFFSRPRPVPKEHGYGLPWSWNGYYHWYDAQTPRREHFSRHTGRLADLYWDVNRVALYLEETAEPGVLRVTADTCTPSLAAILVSIDGRDWTPSSPAFAWPLHAGANTLRVKTRNLLGVEGAPSAIRLAYEPG